MYIAVDLGGTKTLVAVFDTGGKKIEETKFPTPKSYEEFLGDLANNVAKLSTHEIQHVVASVPGLINRNTGVVYALGNLPWKDKSIRDDIKKVFQADVSIENDARLAGLGAAQPLKESYKDILYITVSTGIGGALISDGKIVEAVQDMELGKIPLQFEGSLLHWEEFASGRAIVATYGKRASEIEDPKIWHEIGLKIGYGTAIASATLQPEVIVFGGGAGQYADKFIPTVQEYMEKNLHADCKRPKLLTAQNAEEVGIYGCYELARQLHEKHTA